MQPATYTVYGGVWAERKKDFLADAVTVQADGTLLLLLRRAVVVAIAPFNWYLVERQP